MSGESEVHKKAFAVKSGESKKRKSDGGESSEDDANPRPNKRGRGNHVRPSWLTDEILNSSRAAVQMAKDPAGPAACCPFCFLEWADNPRPDVLHSRWSSHRNKPPTTCQIPRRGATTSAPEEPEEVRIPQHAHALIATMAHGIWSCDSCKMRYAASVKSYRCDTCNFDLCPACLKTSSAPAPIAPKQDIIKSDPPKQEVPAAGTTSALQAAIAEATAVARLAEQADAEFAAHGRMRDDFERRRSELAAAHAKIVERMHKERDELSAEIVAWNTKRQTLAEENARACAVRASYADQLVAIIKALQPPAPAQPLSHN